MKFVTPRKIVIELRYPRADLRIYGVMDKVGFELREKYADWTRQPLLLRILNKQQRISFRMQHRSSAFESLILSQERDVEVVLKDADEVIGVFQKHLPIEKYEQVGIRLWYALDFNQSFEKLRDRIQERYYGGFDHLADVLGARLADTMVSFNLESDDGWKQHFRLGPMTHKEWINTTQIPEDMLGDSGKAELKSAIPENPMYVDCDYYQQDLASSEVLDKCAEAVSIANGRVSRVAKFHKRG